MELPSLGLALRAMIVLDLLLAITSRPKSISRMFTRSWTNWSICRPRQSSQILRICLLRYQLSAIFHFHSSNTPHWENRMIRLLHCPPTWVRRIRFVLNSFFENHYIFSLLNFRRSSQVRDVSLSTSINLRRRPNSSLFQILSKTWLMEVELLHWTWPKQSKKLSLLLLIQFSKQSMNMLFNGD